ncbi:glycosyltransferase [Modestobacter sp. VKM Ac-2978]|uniref:glycosyltransferase n=1 Tax=Modestobacter sp. VKM Ac-2978 TaxID=3004132 RepID=UPI0022AA0624|nr:glycosyltransferase [Modestobacter sp. VKM Ac-2978]MCZ2849925.1 glycosyltransferase [Modestobacter sp. VKM Ac-2978]
MRILFTSTPAYGHLLPMIPLMRAASAAGHETALMTHRSVAPLAADVRLLPAGPDLATTLADVSRRTGAEPLEDPLVSAVEILIETRLTLGAEAAMSAADSFAPDVMICDLVDYLGQLAASSRKTPWVAHGASLPMIPLLADQFAQRAARRFADFGVVPSAPIAYLDPWPDALVTEADRYPAPRIPVRPQPHGSGPGHEGRVHSSHPDGGGDVVDAERQRARVLVTLGTVVDDADVLVAVVASAATADVDLRIAGAEGIDLSGSDGVPDRFEVVGFVPMHDLLRDVDVVVSSGGAGTVLSALSAGVPLVLLPLGLDKPMNAERVAVAGAGLVATAPGDVGALIAAVLTDPSYRRAAEAVAADMAQMRSPHDALTDLIDAIS